MNFLQNNVKNWMIKVGQPTPSFPQKPDNLSRILRVSLLLEEVFEFAEASGIEITLKDDIKPLTIEDLNYNITGEPDLVAISDALGDIDYVSAGGACAYGIDMEPIVEEICRSNDSKLIDGYRRDDGKWIKGPKYSPANLSKIIDKQISDSKNLEFQQFLPI